MRVNLTNGFNRLYIVLAFSWAIYCLFLYPLQKKGEALELYEEEQRFCHDRQYAAQDGLSDCLKMMERGYRTRVEMWSGKNFYAGFWWVLLLVVVVFPSVLYGCCRGALLIAGWVWHGFSAPTSDRRGR
jgi:hypothetical protein